jgi:hypothetical protein
VVYVSTPATAEDGNQVSYGNGGGGPLSVWLLARLRAWHCSAAAHGAAR